MILICMSNPTTCQSADERGLRPASAESQATSKALIRVLAPGKSPLSTMAVTSTTIARNEDKSPSFEGDFASGEVLDGAVSLVSVLFASALDCFEQPTASAKIVNPAKAAVGRARYLDNFIVFLFK